MNASEMDFLFGLFIICLVAAIIKFIGTFLFVITMSDKDKESLDKDQPDNVATHTKFIGSIVYIMGYVIFFNSAILVASAVKHYLL